MQTIKRYPRCILATRCVPWDEAGDFAETIFRRGVRTALAKGTSLVMKISLIENEILKPDYVMR